MSELKQTYEHKGLKPGLVSVLLGTEPLRIIPIGEDVTSVDVIVTIVENRA